MPEALLWDVFQHLMEGAVALSMDPKTEAGVAMRLCTGT